MLCEKCGKNIATTHICSVIDGVKTEKYLCANCAESEGVADFKDLSLGGMLSSMFGDFLSLSPASKEVRCECCGSTFSDIAKRGKAGCPECYKTFYKEFLPYIKRVHGAVKHIGKASEKSFAAPKEDTLLSLKEQLSKLVKEERFEEAAKLRDKIRDLEAAQ